MNQSRLVMRNFFVFCITLGAFSLSAKAMEILPEAPPIPKDNPMTPEKISLGKQLYFDPRLSKTGKVSCNTCHDATGSGTDNLRVSFGIDRKTGKRNSPTVWNSAFMSVQFWDGRAATLEEQAKGPLTNPVEMAMDNHDTVVKRIAKISGYQEQFKKVFGGENSLNIDNTVKAIAAYERTLITPNSPFDRYMKGDRKAMSAQAIRGMELAKNVGCTSCHGGPNFAGPTLPVGTGFYMKFPTMPGTDYEKKYNLSEDLGRYEHTGKEQDKNMWRVPTWRNIALTGPYFHNGSVKTLDEAVLVMAKTQLAKDLKPNEVADIVAFLKSLNGVRPKQTKPELPKDS